MAHRTIIFDSEITQESVITLINTIEELVEDFNITLYFSTDGGLVHIMDILIDCLTRYPSIDVVLTNATCSCGMYIFQIPNKITLGPSFSHGMIHKADVDDLSYRDYRSKDRNDTKAAITHLKRLWSIDRVNYCLTQEQQDQYDSGKDVYLYYNQMKEILRSR